MSPASALDGHNRPLSLTRNKGRSKASPEPKSKTESPTHAAVAPVVPPPHPTPERLAEDEGRDWLDPKATDQARRAAQARQVSGRRRLIDPATCERDYSGDELEFMQAMQEYKQRSGRMFPTWSEVLEVLLELGYAKVAEESDAPFDRQPTRSVGADGGERTRRVASA